MNKPIDITNVILKTDRLTLRPWRESDLKDFYAYASVDGVGQMAGWLPHKDMEESRTILNHFIEGKKTFALEYQGKVIGSLGVEAYREELYPELGRKVTEEEYDEVVNYAIDLGIENGFIQEGETAQESFIPPFDLEGV